MKGTFLLLLVIVTFDTTFTSQDLHARYGQSDVERFRVRPDLDATVQYGSDGRLCRVLLAEPVSVTEVPSSMAMVSGDEMRDATDKFAPPELRGPQINEGSFQASCAVAFMSDYQNVLIERSLTACPTSSGKTDSQTRILFKRDACPAVHSNTAPR